MRNNYIMYINILDIFGKEKIIYTDRKITLTSGGTRRKNPKNGNVYRTTY